MKEIFAFGIGIKTENSKAKTLEVFYPFVSCDRVLLEIIYPKKNNSSNFIVQFAPDDLIEASSRMANHNQQLSQTLLTLSKSINKVVLTVIHHDDVSSTTEEVYLKLTLLSARIFRPNDLNFDRVFETLPNVVWTSDGAIDIEEFPDRMMQSRISGKHLEVFSVDKFPKLINHLVPSQVRVADGSRVRLGAYLGPGTTVLQEGLVNFNAGTEGPNMVEGRISIGVFVSARTDLGGGCSIMGTLYKEAETVISIGEDCVIGANSGAGIPLGSGCTIEAGLYVTAGTKVELLNRSGQRIGVVRARELAGKPNLMFRRNSQTGQVEALISAPTVQMNEAFHTNR
jgi:2,3,4,5-tetrahydropyridine-2-carboxylate N-succinyltransferase